MNYTKIYYQIIAKAVQESREKGNGIYYERHHILPEALWPEYANLKKFPWNGVLLTGKEHFVVHRLLAKIYPKTTMVFAAWQMACTNQGQYRVTSRTYAYLRELIAKKNAEPEICKKKSLSHIGKKQTLEHIKARTEARMQKGSWFQDKDIGQKISKGLKESFNNGNYIPHNKGKKADAIAHARGVEVRKRNNSYIRTPEATEKQKNTFASRTHLPRIVSKTRKQQLSKEKSIHITCPYCNKKGQCIVMYRWHFKNCKQKLTKS